MKLKYIIILIITISFTSCGPVKSTKIVEYPGMYTEKPKTVLFIPPVNNTTAADSKDLFRTTVTPILSEKGYYVLPIEPVFDFLKMNGSYDIAETSETLPLDKFAEFFGADAVLKVTILEWEKNYYVVSGNVEVGVKYELISTHTGELIWQNEKHIKVNTSSSSGNFVADLVGTAISTASLKYIDVTFEVHRQALLEMPAGFHSPRFNKDMKDQVLVPRK